MSQQQLTVKAYLKRGAQQKRIIEQSDEIRRFGIDCDVTTNYEYLLAKITSVFPGLVNKSITLYWKDSDDDMIAFSSDDELMEAMKGITDGIFRVFIVEKRAPKTESQTASDGADVLHPFVTCDGCNGEVRGIRYKCKVCPDYDLCVQCKSTGIHSEHEMLAIERPGMPFAFGFPHGGMQFPGGPMEHVAPPMPPCMGQMPPPPPPYGCFVPPTQGPQQFEPADTHRMNRRAWKRWYRETYGHDHHRRHKKDKKEKKEGKSSSSSSSDSEETRQSPSGDYLKNIGHSVAAMLDPLGIDVEVDVEHHGQRRRCHRGGMGGGMGGPWAWGMRGRHCGPWGMRGGRGGWGGPCHWRKGPFSAGPQETTTAASDSQQSGSEQKTGGASGPAGPGPAVIPEEQIQPRATNSETGEMASGNFSGSPDNGWTILNNGEPAADVEAATSGVRDLDMSDHAAVDDLMSFNVPSDPAIAEALQTMMSMGYSNESGWLTNLLVFHKGDIGRVLDAILAKKQ